MALYPLPIARWTVAAIAVLFAVVLPLSLHEYYLSIINLSLIAVVGALGLNIRGRSRWATPPSCRSALTRPPTLPCITTCRSG
jgi:hypothetical protein